MLNSIIESIKRFFYWGWKLRHSYDFDAHSIYPMLQLKLERVYNEMLNNSHLVWNSDPNNKQMRKLKEAGLLAERLSSDRYELKAFTDTEEKFGYSRTWKKLDNGMLSYKSKWVKNDKLGGLYFKSRITYYSNLRKAELKRFHHLLERYTSNWWD